MDYISPARLMEEVEAASTKKAALSTRALVLKGFLSVRCSLTPPPSPSRRRKVSPQGPRR
jgi:hypothetical protein